MEGILLSFEKIKTKIIGNVMFTEQFRNENYWMSLKKKPWWVCGGCVVGVRPTPTTTISLIINMISQKMVGVAHFQAVMLMPMLFAISSLLTNGLEYIYMFSLNRF